MESQTNQALQFRQLHRGPGVLILPNAWDVASARIFEDAGFPAIATTSAGIAFSLGYPDGQRIPREEMMARIRRIARAVHVPVTADVESGYGSTAEDAARTTRELIQAGVVGMNLEDAGDRRDQPLIDLQLAVEKIRAAREAAMQLHAQIVVNARTDVFLLPGGNPDADYSEALRRLVALRPRTQGCRNDWPAGESRRMSTQHSRPAGNTLDSGTRKAGRRPRKRGIGPHARDARTAAASGGGTQDFRNVQRDGGSCAVCRSEQAVGPLTTSIVW